MEFDYVAQLLSHFNSTETELLILTYLLVAEKLLKKNNYLLNLMAFGWRNLQ